MLLGLSLPGMDRPYVVYGNVERRLSSGRLGMREKPGGTGHATLVRGPMQSLYVWEKTSTESHEEAWP